MRGNRKLKGVWVLAVFFLLFQAGAVYAEEKPKQKEFKPYSLGEILVSEEEPGSKDVGLKTEVDADDIRALKAVTKA